MKTKRFSVVFERIEDERAIFTLAEDETAEIMVPVTLLPGGCVEGDMLDIELRKSEELTEEASLLVSNLSEKMHTKR